MRKNTNRANHTQIIKKRISLGKIGETEKWLDEMSQAGWQLTRIDGNRFHFSECTPHLRHHFLLSPEKGANSSSWVYYEFLQNGGTQIPHSGTRFMSPDLVLWISDADYQKAFALYRYYFAHRNYRLWHRLLTNLAAAGSMFLLGVLIAIVDICLLPSIFYILLGSFCVGCLNLGMLLEFRSYLRSTTFPDPWKRPRRPGYE